MPKQKHALTLKEYLTKAMLLGREYDPVVHSFYFSSTISGLPIEDADDLDADTMEPIPPAIVTERLSQVLDGSPPQYKGTTHGKGKA